MPVIGITNKTQDDLGYLAELLSSQAEQAGVLATKMVRRLEALGVTFDPTKNGIEAVSSGDWSKVTPRYGSSVTLAKALSSLAFQTQMIASLSAPLLDAILAGTLAVDPPAPVGPPA